MHNDGLPNQDTDQRSRHRAAWIISILVALAAAVIAPLSAFAHSDAAPTASDATSTAPAPGHATTAPHSETAHDPSGSFGVQAHGLRVHIFGTATDPDSARSTKVVYYLNNSARETALANQAGHRYSRDWTMPRGGTYRVTVVALNDGKGKARTVLGSKALKLIDPATRNPHGKATFHRSGTTLWISGRLSDPDNARARIWVHAEDNGRLIGSAPSNGNTQRYGMTVRLHDGVNNVAVRAFNIGMGTRNVIVGWAGYRVTPAWISRYSGNQAIAAKMLGSYGWGPGQMAPLIKLWNRESGWHASAYNPDGGAYGIPQALPSSKLSSAGRDWRTNPSTQIRWGLRYIKDRYGSPGAAWAHEVAQGWY